MRMVGWDRLALREEEAVERVCAWCRRLIVGKNEPGEPARNDIKGATHGCCSECLERVKR